MTTKRIKIEEVRVGTEILTRLGWFVVVTDIATGPDGVELTCHLGRTDTVSEMVVLHVAWGAEVTVR